MAFTAEIPVKSYTKAYLENNCGSPCDLTNLPEISDLFIGCIKFPRFHRDTITKCNYSDKIEIIVSSDIFYRYGYKLSKTDVVKFNHKCEAFIKFNARVYIMAHHSLGVPVSKCIREFQNEFQFTEDQFSYDAIKKDFERNGSKIKIKLFEEYRKELKNIFLVYLSTLGTINNPQ
jgi:hypothetical protein